MRLTREADYAIRIMYTLAVNDELTAAASIAESIAVTRRFTLKILGKLLEAGFTDIFRFRNPDATGAYSWWSYRFNARKNNAGWRIDYFLVSDRIADNIQAAPIYADVFGSDHCPVGLEINL